MTVKVAGQGSNIAISSDGKLCVNGKALLTQVPENVTVTQSSASSYGVFIGASSAESNSRLVFPLGVFKGHRFMCCFRFSLWWMTQRMGCSGSEIPNETQFLLAEMKGDTTSVISENGLPSEHSSGDHLVSDHSNETQYVILLPLLDGSYRACLQGNEANDFLELCLESGDKSVKGTGGLHSILLHAGTNPFQIISEAVRAAESHLQTFRRRETKKMPGILDWFGWCTWDAFYTNVTADGVRHGLKSLEEGGTPAKFLIIDDGWQATEQAKGSGLTSSGTQFPSRLTDVRENFKFQKDGKEGEKRPEDPELGIQHLIKEIKDKHHLKFVYMWHAITGYWGGIKPAAPGTQQYDATLQYPVPSEGVLKHQPSMSDDSLTVNGLGLAHPEKVFQFYDELHSYLAAAGVDGVKVDVQNIIETLGTGFGGRVSITGHYQKALEASVARNFPNNGCIACMCHNNDGFYNIKNTAVVRASDDFWPRDPASHTIHIAAVAYNSLFLGEFMQPDWDMFHSLHPAAEYHAAARAISGGPIYVSDKPGQHDFALLKKLVLSDGSILRAQLPARPTRDSLFTDPARDGQSLLKIWNSNKYTGVVGVFNCQGAGWCKVEKKYLIHDSAPTASTGTVFAKDVDSLDTLDSTTPASMLLDGQCAMYSHKEGKVVLIARDAGLAIKLNVLQYDIFTVSSVKRFPYGTAFATVGLIDMFNCGGAITDMEFEPMTSSVTMQVHGSGMFGAYASQKPKECQINNVPCSEYSYDPLSGLLKVNLPEGQNLWQKVGFTF